MKKTSLMIAVLIALTGVAQAVQMTLTDNNWDKITQTCTIQEFIPGVNTTYEVLFKQFDTQGGARTLQSVTVSYTLNAYGGYFSADNDAASQATATVTWGANARIANNTFDVYLPAGATTVRNAGRSSGLITLEANQGDEIGVYNSGVATDKYMLTGADISAPETASYSGTRSSSLDSYLGVSDIGFDFIANQSSDTSTLGGAFYSGGPANASAVLTVTYNYVPEPTSMALLAIGCAVLGLRRHGQNTQKV